MINISINLEKISKLQNTGFPEAVIIYAARFGELTVREFLSSENIEPSRNFYGNICLAEDLDLIPGSVLIMLDAVRRAGNHVRHILSDTCQRDEQTILALVERIAEWYFHTTGKNSEQTTRFTSVDETVRNIFRKCENMLSVKNTASETMNELVQSSAAGPVPASIAAAHILALGDTAAARFLLDNALAKYPDDTRLKQLHALELSRHGLYNDAISILRKFGEDEETIGILAGALKRKWMTEGDVSSLQKSAKLYRKGWIKLSYPPYLGINAAATILFLGGAKEAAETARAVYNRLSALKKRVSGRVLNYWNEATIAEALLIMGKKEEASCAYEELYARSQNEKGNFASTEIQRKKITEALGAAAPMPFMAGMAFSAPEYNPPPSENAGLHLGGGVESLIETLARKNHDNWSRMRLDEGWTWGPVRDDLLKQHPDLVEYDKLSEIEKDYDRATARQALQNITALGYRIVREG